jgi:hypothetical protein
MGTAMKFCPQFSRLLLTYGIGLAVPLASSAPEFNLLGTWVQSASAEGGAAQSGGEEASKGNVAFVDHGDRECEAAKRRAIELAPELLALADWPLDDHVPLECATRRHENVAASEDALRPAEVVTGSPPVVNVMAFGAGKESPVVGEQWNPLGLQMAAVDAASLDEVRGGFELADSNIQLSFGIERAVYINGELVASTVLNLKDLQLTAGAGAAPLTLPDGSTAALAVIQNGSGNHVSTQISPNLAATIIQNSLNDQKIQNVTTINATVNSLQVLRSMSVQSAIQDGIVSSLRR